MKAKSYSRAEEKGNGWSNGEARDEPVPGRPFAMFCLSRSIPAAASTRRIEAAGSAADARRRSHAAPASETVGDGNLGLRQL